MKHTKTKDKKSTRESGAPLPNPEIMALTGRIHLSWKRYLQKSLTPHRTSLKQMYLLNQLVKQGFLYPSAIAEMLYCDRPTASTVINTLEKKGWVKRNRDRGNAKQIRIEITEVGRSELAEISPAFNEAVKAFDPLSCLNQKEKEALFSLLTRLLSHLGSMP